MGNDIVNWFNNKSIQAQEILLVVLLLDDSGSIGAAGNTKAIIDGYNGFLEMVKNAPGEVRVKTMLLNDRSDKPFKKPEDAEVLNPQTYSPQGNTPLFLRSLEALACVVQEAKKLTRQGKTVRTMTLIFTDGGDNASVNTKAADVERLVDVMLTTDTHIIGGCAVNDHTTNFWKVFTSMGIPEHWIKVLENDHKEVKRTMINLGSMVSESSTSQESFSTTGRIGFKKPITNIN